MKPKKTEEVSGKRVGIWIRVSTEDQAQGDSPQHHEERARGYAISKGWQVIEVYHLEAVSGKAVMGHVEAKRMMKDIERGHITGLIFSKLARLGRNTTELLAFSDFFQLHEADLISLQESIDTSSPAGRLFYTMIAAMAHWEREEIGSRVAASIPIRAKLGKPLGGAAPFGYKWSPEKQLVVNPETASVRKKIYDLFLTHRRKRRVATILNEAGHRTQTGHAFTVTTIERLLRDPVAKGTRRTNYVKHDAEKGQSLKPESDWVYVDVEPIVSADVWNQCNQILDEQRASKYKRPARKTVQLFGGRTWCECGEKMYVKSNTPKYVCGKCHNKIGIEDLEALFYDELTAYSLSPKEISNFLLAANTEIAEKEDMIQLLKRDQAKVKSEMDRIMELYVAGEIPVKGFGVRYNPLEERFNQIDAEIPRLQGAIDYLKGSLLSKDEILKQAQNLYDRWPKMDAEKKRRAVEAILRKITIGRENIHIGLFYLPTHQDPTDDDSDPNPDDDPTPPQPRNTTPSLSSRNPKISASSEDMAKGSLYAASW